MWHAPAGPLGCALVRVEGDETTAVEHGLDHRERAVDLLLEQKPAAAQGLGVRAGPQGGRELAAAAHPADPRRRRSNRRLDEGGVGVPVGCVARVADRGPARAGDAEGIQGARGAELVLNARQGGEGRDRGRQPRRPRAAGDRPRHDGRLLLGGQEHLVTVPRRDGQRCVQPGQGIGAERGHPMPGRDRPGPPGQRRAVRGQDPYAVPRGGQQPRGLPGGQARALAEKDAHAPSLNQPRGAAPGLCARSAAMPEK